MTTMRIAGLVGKASTVSFLLTAGLFSCSGHSTPVTQTLRTGAARGTGGNVVGGAGGLVIAASRRPNAREHPTIHRPSRLFCIVGIDVGEGTGPCVQPAPGASGCPPLHEATGPRLP